MKVKILVSILSALSFCSLANANSGTYADLQGGNYTASNTVNYFDYSPDSVYTINMKYGTATLIQLSKDEVIDEDKGLLGMGNANDYSVGVKGNNVIFKPLSANTSPTNMIIVTNKRSYTFDLRSSKRGVPTYVVRFVYPTAPSKIDYNKPIRGEGSIKLRETAKGSNLYIDSRINVNYYAKGNMTIKPTAVWDDNLFTYLKYDNANDLPVPYKILDDGSESVVNSHVDGDTLVVHEVTPTLRLRIGNSVLDLANANKQPSTFNTSGASKDSEKRVDSNEQ